MDGCKKLTMEEYCQLFEHIILAEYDNLFHNAELRRDLGLENGATGPFAVEYLSAALYLLEDLIPDCTMPEHIGKDTVSQVRAHVFRRILPKTAPEGMEAPYILYSLKRSAEFAQFYARNDETMKLLIENCLDQAKLSDPVSRMPQSVYLMNLLPGIVQLFCDLLCSVTLAGEEPVCFQISMPESCH